SPKVDITCITCSRLMPEMVAMAMPSFCTSLAFMCLSTSAASSSPSESSSTAARCTPVSALSCALFIAGHPVLDHLRDLLGIRLHRFARLAQAVFVGTGREGAHRRRLLVRERGDHAGLVVVVHDAHVD